MKPVRCSYRKYMQTGKRCAHLKAVELYIHNGSVRQWLVAETAREERRQITAGTTKKSLGLPRERKMRSDELDAKDIESVKRLLKKYDDRRAKREKEAALRHSLPTAPPGATTPGRPRHIRPMQPYRTPTRPRAPQGSRSPSLPQTPSRATSAKRFLSLPHVPVFNARPGPKKKERLAANSLLPATEAVREALRTVRRGNAAPAGTPFLPEEFQIASMTFEHWREPGYQLRLDECLRFIDCLNNSCIAREHGIVFWVTPAAPLAAVLRGRRTTMPDLCTELRAQRHGRFADLIDTRAGQRVNRLIFLHHENVHWTVHDHDLTSRPRKIRCLNSLPTSSPMNIDEQHAIASAVEASEIWALAEPDIDPSLRGVQLSIEVIPTGMQTDNSSCGFWAVFFAWTCLLGIDLSQEAIADLRAEDLKDLLQEICTSYVSEDGGLTTDVLREWFDDFDASVEWDLLPPVFSCRPTEQSAALDLNTLLVPTPVSPRPAVNSATSVTQSTTVNSATNDSQCSHTQEVVVVPSVLQRKDLQNKLERFRRSEETSWWEHDQERFQRSAVETLWNGNGTTTFIVDALLAGPTGNLANGQWDEAFGEVPLPTRPPASRVYIVPQSVAAVLMKTQGVRKASKEGLAPKGRMKNGFWFKRDVFELHLLIVPMFWKDDSHWLCAIVDMREKTIVIYDSIRKLGRAKAAYGRIFKILQYEHRARREGVNLAAAGWSPEFTGDALPTVPNQGASMYCGVFMIKFILEVMCGRPPNRAQFSFTQGDAKRLSEALVLRLMQTLRVEDMSQTEQVQPSSAPMARSEGGAEQPVPRQEVTRAEVSDHVVATSPAAHSTCVSEKPPTLMAVSTMEMEYTSGDIVCADDVTIPTPVSPAPTSEDTAAASGADADGIPTVETRGDDGANDCGIDLAAVVESPTVMLLDSNGAASGARDLEIVPMKWPADLEYRSLGRVHSAPLTERRAALRKVLEAALPGMNDVLAGLTDVDPVFAKLVHDCLTAHGYDDEGEEIIPGSSSGLGGLTPWGFYMGHVVDRMTTPKEPRHLLDAGDETLCGELARTLERRQPLRGPNERSFVKCAGAGKVYLAFMALSHYTGCDITCVEEAVQQGHLRRPLSKYERAWRAYDKGWQMNLVDTHRIITPDIVVELPVFVE
ncbi:Ulp1 protease family, C-terminal catalytic domain-containing protein [Earliella scabrosa]|nr:Ulp1 protease family, C-terminal catalytic domain-containing protein [Earliella scabrosa]